MSNKLRNFTFVKISKQPTPSIKTTAAKTIVGLRIETSLQDNETMALWRSFGPRRKHIENQVDRGSYSIQEYEDNFLSTPFLPSTLFKKWAGVAVTLLTSIPDEMEILEIPAGQWAVFLYKGTTSDFGIFLQYVFGQWLPASGYALDDRPHYEYMAEGYLGPNHPDAEEEVWIPIK